jgi:hypothetical protein
LEIWRVVMNLGTTIPVMYSGRVVELPTSGFAGSSSRN